MSGVAERLYYDSPALEFTATVTDIRLNSEAVGESGEKQQLWQVALDRTAFYPEGGGQPWDLGTLTATARSGATLEIPVERVEEDEAGEVWHYIRKPLIADTEITGRVDAARRMDHAQQHTGQHLLSAVFLAELGARTVSFHLGAESSTIDLMLREGMEKLSDEELARVEAAVNRLIYEDRAMRPRWVEREEAEAMLARGELRRLPERSGPMRIVEMQGIEHNACGGTHVASTGAIGGLLVRKVEKAKKGWRVEFVCGLRAVQTARRDYRCLDGIARSLSVAPADVPGRVENLLAMSKRAKKDMGEVLYAFAEAEAYQLDARFPAGVLIETHYLKRNLYFAQQLARGLAGKGRGAVISVSDGDEHAVLLLRPTDMQFHAGDFVKAFLADLYPGSGLRGGGNAELAQIVLDHSSTASLLGNRLAHAVRQLRGSNV